MKKLILTVQIVLAALFILYSNSCEKAEKQVLESQDTSIDLDKARKTIEKIDTQFAKDFGNGDSVALAAYYAKDGHLGSVKGKDNLIHAWGRIISNAVKNGTPNVKYTTTSLSSDGEFLIETGVYKYTDIAGKVNRQGKYLVVWKQENDRWKIYRDIGL